MMNKQQFAEHLIAVSAAGGFPSAVLDDDTASGVRCLYRGPDGKKCAAGHAIGDEDYTPYWDERGTTASSWDVERAVSKNVDKDTVWHMQRLQHAHDDLARECLKSGAPWPHEAFVQKVKDILGVE